MTENIYELGQGTRQSFPYGVDFVPDDQKNPIIFWEGSGHSSGYGRFSAQQALEPQWKNHLEIAGVMWFVPFIERLARQENVELTEVLEAYKQVHGQAVRVVSIP